MLDVVMSETGMDRPTGVLKGILDDEIYAWTGYNVWTTEKGAMKSVKEFLEN